MSRSCGTTSGRAADRLKAAVLGSPIAHSLSPVLHNAAYQALELTDWSYTAIECDAAGLPALVAGGIAARTGPACR